MGTEDCFKKLICLKNFLQPGEKIPQVSQFNSISYFFLLLMLSWRKAIITGILFNFISICLSSCC